MRQIGGYCDEDCEEERRSWKREQQQERDAIQAAENKRKADAAAAAAAAAKQKADADAKYARDQCAKYTAPLETKAAAEAKAAADEQVASLQLEIKQLKALLDAPRLAENTPVKNLKPLPPSTPSPQLSTPYNGLNLGGNIEILSGGKRRSKSSNKPKKSAKRVKTAKRSKSRKIRRRHK